MGGKKSKLQHQESRKVTTTLDDFDHRESRKVTTTLDDFDHRESRKVTTTLDDFDHRESRKVTTILDDLDHRESIKLFKNLDEFDQAACRKYKMQKEYGASSNLNPPPNITSRTFNHDIRNSETQRNRTLSNLNSPPNITNEIFNHDIRITETQRNRTLSDLNSPPNITNKTFNNDIRITETQRNRTLSNLNSPPNITNQTFNHDIRNTETQRNSTLSNLNSPPNITNKIFNNDIRITETQRNRTLSNLNSPPTIINKTFNHDIRNTETQRSRASLNLNSPVNVAAQTDKPAQRNTDVETRQFPKKDDVKIESDSCDKVSAKHEVFLKKLIARYCIHSRTRNRGFYCDICNEYLIYFKDSRIHHDETEKHKYAVKDKPDISRHYCRTCKAYFFGNREFWLSHLNMELHQVLTSKNKLNNCSKKESGKSVDNTNSSGNNKIKNNSIKQDEMLDSMAGLSVLGVLKEQKNQYLSIQLDLKKEIIKNFYFRLFEKSIDKFSFYCHNCEIWTDDDNLWENHNFIHKNDQSIRNATVCIGCKLIIIGSDKFKDFHSTAVNHENFKQFLLFKFNNFTKTKKSSDDDSSDNNDEDDDDKDDYKDDKQRRKPTELLLEDLPPETKRNDLLLYFKDFGRVGKIYLHFGGPSTAKLSFQNSMSSNVNVCQKK
ncbi:uncharacterized protein LOC142330966 isoform X2 [Lycorma delicatula]|uniref:uncharacterized protein LOC142330966 isoform X2 n=1 Tax=Lycorma delicatula TaxID=130591 RepID=UPI003F5103D1